MNFSSTSAKLTLMALHFLSFVLMSAAILIKVQLTSSLAAIVFVPLTWIVMTITIIVNLIIIYRAIKAKKSATLEKFCYVSLISSLVFALYLFSSEYNSGLWGYQYRISDTQIFLVILSIMFLVYFCAVVRFGRVNSNE